MPSLSLPSVDTPANGAAARGLVCTHWRHRLRALTLSALHTRFRSPAFQRALTTNSVHCCVCNDRQELKNLWACIECVEHDAVRCGRFALKHSSHHADATGHAICMNLRSRLIWCYECDEEVKDIEVDPASTTGSVTVTPQQVYAALDATDPNLQDETSGSEDGRGKGYLEYCGNPHGGRVGLTNLGNTCYLNSSLQTIMHCPPMVAFFSDIDKRITADNHRLELARDFSELLQKNWGGKYNTCAPRDIVRDIWRLNPFFRGYGQHDAQEFIRSFLDNLHEGLKHVCEYSYNPSADREAKNRKDIEEVAQKAAAARAAARRPSTSTLTPSTTTTSTPTSAQRQPPTNAPPLPPQNTPSMDIKTSVATTTSGDGSVIAEEQTEVDNNESERKTQKVEPKKEEKKTKVRPRYHEHSIVSDIFQGILHSQVRCGNCGYASTVEEPFYDLSLELPKEVQLKRVGAERGIKALTPAKQGWFGGFMNWVGITSPPLSLETCLHSFCTSDQLLKARDSYRCDGCKEKVDAQKTLSLFKPPEVLCIHIKRFSHNSYFGSKLSRHVIFPLNNLDISAFMKPASSPSSTPVTTPKRLPASSTTPPSSTPTSRYSPSTPSPPAYMYDLCGVVRHMGGVSGGHYVAFARQHVTNKWYKFDDKDVEEVSEDTVRKQEAYVLFYRRKPDLKQVSRTMDDIKRAEADDGQPRCFLSRAWIKKVQMLNAHEPVDNRDLCCRHGYSLSIPSTGDQRALSISQSGFKMLIDTYGGGPYISGQRPECAGCLEPILRDRERKEIEALDFECTRTAIPGDPYWLIHDGWLTQWRKYVTSGGDKPGPITNDALLQEDGITPKEGIRVSDYRGLHEPVWNVLAEKYGGGPVICRGTLNIYAAPFTQQATATTEDTSVVSPQAALAPAAAAAAPQSSSVDDTNRSNINGNSSSDAPTNEAAPMDRSDEAEATTSPTDEEPSLMEQ